MSFWAVVRPWADVMGKVHYSFAQQEAGIDSDKNERFAK
jgi:hypothetical protein